MGGGLGWAAAVYGTAAARGAAQSRSQCADDIVQVIFASPDEFTNGSQTDDATAVVLHVP